MIAFFPGKFVPPHLGHIITIMSIYEKYDKVIVGITDESDLIISQKERESIFQSVFKHLSKIKEAQIPVRPKFYKETFSLYMARFKRRNQLKRYLLKNKIEVKIHYPIPLHLQKPLKLQRYKKGDFPITDEHTKKIKMSNFSLLLSNNEI